MSERRDARALEDYITVRGIRLRIKEAGEGPLVVMLHGFPEFSYQWRSQIPQISAAGFRVVAPDQRGYGLSDKPKSLRHYRIEVLTSDVAALVEACGVKTATLVGHDWGGIVAYYTAMLFPERVDRLVILNAPHPAHFERIFWRRFSQMRRSWYVAFFMVPRIPEALAKARKWSGFRRAFADVTPGSFSEEDFQRYVEAWSQPGAPKSMIDWYRAAVFRRPSSLRALLRPIERPTLVLWGDRDRALLKEFAEPPKEWVPMAKSIHFPNASHWVHHDEPVRVVQEIISFLHEEPARVS